MYRESRACTYYIQDCIVVTLERALAHAHTHTHTHTHVAFGNERRTLIQVSTLIPAHNALWVSYTENGVLVSFPFTVPTMVAEEAG